MKFIPKKSQMLGRLVQLATKGGIILPELQQKESKIVVIDRLGKDVKEYKVGDFVVPRKYEVIYLRGLHWIILDEADVVGSVEEIAMDEITIDGKPVPKAEANAA